MEDAQSPSPSDAVGCAIAALERLGPIAVESRLITKADYGLLMRSLRKIPGSGGAKAPGRALTVKTVAERLGCSKKTVFRMIDRGQLPSLRLTGSRKSLRVLESAVEAMVACA